jgi:hypothetical protein
MEKKMNDLIGQQLLLKENKMEKNWNIYQEVMKASCGKDSVRESFCITKEIAAQCQEGNRCEGKQGNPPQ